MNPDAQLNAVVADMSAFMDNHPEFKPSDRTRDAVMVINRKSGCYTTPDKIIHTDACSCSDDYDNYAQDQENW